MKKTMTLPDELFNVIPQKAATLHRLLGANAFNDNTRYNVNNPLQIDVLVVDETSMIDLPMMAKLLNALKPETRLILLGDQAQLASVEAGAVLGERHICRKLQVMSWKVRCMEMQCAIACAI